ncbi:MAG TPA: SLBB domain-containing protein [Pyrinomonadaceae bacterium]|nr:SLBB domain-containing protein [Pyrinomonadaceae bacterium]
MDGVDFIDEPIFALCRNGEEVAKDLVKGFSKMLRNPQVEVRILDRSGRPISYLYGAVKTPKRFKLSREIKLNELIILSGGITEKASGEIQILRSSFLDCNERKTAQTEENQNIKVKQEVGTKTLNIKISDLIQGKLESNPTILSGDIVTVLEANPIYVIGGVANPRQINSASKMTFTRAIASAGGFSKDADTKNIQIFRKENNEIKIIDVDLGKIESKEIDDILLEKFDIIDVGQRGREKRKIPPFVKNGDRPETRILQIPLRIIE